MNDSIEEVYCIVVVKLSGNIMVHALVDYLFIFDIMAKVFL